MAKKAKLRRGAIIVVSVVVVMFGGFVGFSLLNGDLAPVDAAARYSGGCYVSEQEVSDYIQVYREQMDVDDVSDADWATFLAAYELTPERLRFSTARQLVIDRLVQMKADELGLEAQDAEVDASIDVMRDSYGLGSEDLFEQTMAERGQTLEGLRDVYRQAIVRRLVLSSEVEMPVPTDAQVKDHMVSYDASLADPVLKHTYCFRLQGLDEGASTERIGQVQQARHRFLEGPRTPDAFSALVKELSNDATLISNEGANGWNADESEYGDEYRRVLEGLGVGEVSDVFVDGDGYAFIWVNSTFELPIGQEAVNALDSDAVPVSLWGYLSDSAAYDLWEDACDDYIEQLLEDADVTYYPMPENVPYNVDMSLADVQLEEVTGEE